MPGLDPGIHDFLLVTKAWMVGTSQDKPDHDDVGLASPASRYNPRLSQHHDPIALAAMLTIRASKAVL